ncbi:MAG: 5-amino-6-(D-ribitylamino)uracil--L-tyrosine 4-hydroxyphenyl transferase CofH [Acidimicrobiales bacterium]
MQRTESPADLINLPTEALLELARAIRDETYGTTVTYSPKAFFPVTMLCRDRCGYCTFAKAPAALSSAYMDHDDVRRLAERAVNVGVTEALLTLGERPELRYRRAQTFLAAAGVPSTIEYVQEVASILIDEFGLLPHPNAGALDRAELARLRTRSVSQGMMVESLRADLSAHRLAPDKTPERRLATLEFAGELRIPFTTGILIGIGENELDRVSALTAIAAAHRRHGHVQEVIIQNFLPKPRTGMADASPPSTEEHLRAIALARILLPAAIAVQAPPNLSGDIRALLDAGINDLGGISPITSDHVNPERPWPHLDQLRYELDAAGFDLVPRLPVYPRYAFDRSWIDPTVRPSLLAHADASGLGREEAWHSGAAVTEKLNLREVRRERHDPDLDEIFEGVEGGTPVDSKQLMTLFEARGNRFAKVVEFADHLRRRTVGDTVTFVSNRNINYTNICTFKCRFCAFSKGPLSLNLRGTPYLLSMSEIVDKVLEAQSAGATEVCLQGGIHPSFDGEFYFEVVRAIHEAAPAIHIHAFSALEIDEGARRLGWELPAYLSEMVKLGLKTLPGTAAEILDDDVREELCPDKLRTDRWLEIHEVAHEVGLRSNVTIMFGAIETPESWVTHLVRTRDLQQRTRGFTEFVPLPFVHMAAPIFLAGNARRGPTFREAVLMHAVGRIAYHGLIDNVQASWVKMGTEGASILLRSGANDLGGTLMEENISHAAGSEHGRELGITDLIEVASTAGRTLAQRNTLYDIVNHEPSPATAPAHGTTPVRLHPRTLQ